MTKKTIIILIVVIILIFLLIRNSDAIMKWVGMAPQNQIDPNLDLATVGLGETQSTIDKLLKIKSEGNLSSAEELMLDKKIQILKLQIKMDTQFPQTAYAYLMAMSLAELVALNTKTKQELIEEYMELMAL